jgi:hypothetical protein
MVNISEFGRAVAAGAGWSAAVVVAVAVSGCASMGLGRPSEQVVQERAQARWDALVKGDLDAAYRFISPPGRSLVSREAYENSIKRGFWNAARVTKVECGSPEACDVDVAIDYAHEGRKFSTALREKWVKQDSDWWYLLQR